MILETLRLLFLGAQDTIFVILGAAGTPNGHWGSDVGFHRFLNRFGEPPGTYFGHIFFYFSVIRGGKMTDSFQVHVFCGPGLEMMP